MGGEAPRASVVDSCATHDPKVGIMLASFPPHVRACVARADWAVPQLRDRSRVTTPPCAKPWAAICELSLGICSWMEAARGACRREVVAAGAIAD